MKIDLLQWNARLGDVTGNLARLAEHCAQPAPPDLIITPECYATGYPLEDLVLKRGFLRHVETAILRFMDALPPDHPALLLGTPWREGEAVYNAVLLIKGGEITAIIRKRHLPNYGVFDEKRIFASHVETQLVTLMGRRIGVLVCEDLWQADVAADLAGQGAEILICLNASPFESGLEHSKRDLRLKIARARVQETNLPLIYLNLIGGQDELVFDGGSFALMPDAAEPQWLIPAWTEASARIEWKQQIAALPPLPPLPEPDRLSEIYQAMMLGLRDYVHKNGFPGVILGLSGGIDSALSAVVAVDALGAEAVHAVMMPSPYTRAESVQDAATLAQNLGIRLDQLDIAPLMQAYETVLTPLIGKPEGVTAENIQPRSRAVLLMALSNAEGRMLLTTGNKSEMSVGYATLYGDMCGGYSVLKDLYKTDVFALSLWRNLHHPTHGLGATGAVMPERIITRPPSAELKPDQEDTDSLPPYDVLDSILHAMIEEDASVAEIIQRGHDSAIVQRIRRLLDAAEYKRRQSPPGVKLSARHFGRDRRYPITNLYRDEAG